MQNVSYFLTAKIVIQNLLSHIDETLFYSVNIDYLFETIEYELNRDPNEALYYILHTHDPSIIGNYESEVYDEIYEYGNKEEMLDRYHQLKILRKYSGNRCDGYSYPIKMKPTDIDRIGKKRVIHEAKYLDEIDRSNIELELY